MLSKNIKEILNKTNLDCLLEEDTKVLKDKVVKELCNTTIIDLNQDNRNVACKLRTVAGNLANKDLSRILTIFADNLDEQNRDVLMLLNNIAKDTACNTIDLVAQAEITQMVNAILKEQKSDNVYIN